jgi:hypothetical protein
MISFYRISIVPSNRFPFRQLPNIVEHRLTLLNQIQCSRCSSLLNIVKNEYVVVHKSFIRRRRRRRKEKHSSFVSLVDNFKLLNNNRSMPMISMKLSIVIDSVMHMNMNIHHRMNVKCQSICIRIFLYLKPLIVLS